MTEPLDDLEPQTDEGPGTAEPNANGPGIAGVVLLPGLAVWRRWPVVGALLFIAGVMAPCFAILMVIQNRNDLIGLFTRPAVLRGTAIVAVCAVFSRFIAVWLTSDRVRDPDVRKRMRLIGTGLVVLIALPTAFAVTRMEQARSVVKTVFQQDASHGAVAAAKGQDPNADQFQTVLMMGSDEGSDRMGLRTDSMIIAFVHKATGHTTLVSVPRNLTKVRFPPGTPMAEKYPNGFDDLVNAIYMTVIEHSSLKAAYSKDGSDPGIKALMEGLSYSLGITINDFVMVNSCAFVRIVDAVGGVKINVEKKLPMPAELRCSSYRLTPTIGPGLIYMDGTKALGYVRSRKADNDYYRMQRQRTLIQAIAKQIGISTLLAHFGELADGVKADVRTSMTVQEARSLMATLQAGGGKFESVGLVPPIVEPGHPDYDKLRAYIQELRQTTAKGLPAPTVPTVATTAG
jgi:LCP family protein required for cell wall assembly